MIDCNDAEMRDLLPDFVADTLDVGTMSAVQAHLLACAACGEEVELLRVAHAVRPVSVPIDVARIVAALPSPRPSLAAVRATLPPTVARPVARRRVVSGAWRMAATLAAVLVGGWSVVSLRDDRPGAPGQVATNGGGDTPRGLTPRDSAVAVQVESLPSSARAEIIRPAPAAATVAVAVSRGDRPGTAMSLGDLSEYSDDELQQMLDRLEKWDGASSTDPLPTVPILPVSERGSSR